MRLSDNVYILFLKCRDLYHGDAKKYIFFTTWLCLYPSIYPFKKGTHHNVLKSSRIIQKEGNVNFSGNFHLFTLINNFSKVPKVREWSWWEKKSLFNWRKPLLIKKIVIEKISIPHENIWSDEWGVYKWENMKVMLERALFLILINFFAIQSHSDLKSTLDENFQKRKMWKVDR